MNYLTFPIPDIYVSLANMLEQYGINVDVNSLLMEMCVPCLFIRDGDGFRAGLSLLEPGWFDLYLNPLGLRMKEQLVTRARLPRFLEDQKAAMLTLAVEENQKRMVVYTGIRNGSLVFLNSKRQEDPGKDILYIPEWELDHRVSPKVRVITLESCTPTVHDLGPIMLESMDIIRENIQAVKHLSREKMRIRDLRKKVDPLFRPMLMEVPILLPLLKEDCLSRRLFHLRDTLLDALERSPTTQIELWRYFRVGEYEFAAELYITAINEHLKRLGKPYVKDEPAPLPPGVNPDVIV